MTLTAPRIFSFPAMKLVGTDARYEFGPDMSRMISEQWQRMGPDFGSIPGQKDKVAFGISHSMDATGFGYFAGVEVDDASTLLSGYVVYELPAQRYVAFEHPGHLSTMCDTIDAIWKQWLPTSGEAASDNPVMIERYGETFDPAVGQGDIEIWLNLKS